MRSATPALFSRSSVPRGASLAAVACLLAACGSAIQPDDAGRTTDARDVARDGFDGAPGPYDYGDEVGPPCERGRCAPGRFCCVASRRCVLDADAERYCPVPPPITTEYPPCARNEHCPAGTYCQPAGRYRMCGGAGICRSTSNCDTCSGGSEYCSVCGCDGNTYENIQSACAAGVPIAIQGACGVGRGEDGGTSPPRVGCADDGQCSAGYRCCAITGTCIAETCVGCCAIAPPDTDGYCRSNRDCPRIGTFCGGVGCDALGTCIFTGGAAACLDGVEGRSVCGCDGRTYMNECFARAAGVRIENPDGPCR